MSGFGRFGGGGGDLSLSSPAGLSSSLSAGVALVVALVDAIEFVGARTCRRRTVRQGLVLWLKGIGSGALRRRRRLVGVFASHHVEEKSVIASPATQMRPSASNQTAHFARSAFLLPAER